MKFKQFALIGLFTLIFALSVSAYQPTQQETLSELTITQFTEGETNGFVITDDGLVMEDGVETAVYTSPEIAATIPFNALVPNWITNLPHNAEIGFMLRTRPNNGEWTEWQIIETHADWNEPDEEKAFGEMIFTHNAEELHAYIQYSISLGRSNNVYTPIINEIGFSLINSTGMPSTEELIQRQQALNALSGIQSVNGSNPRPTIISREVWCISPDCDYTEDLEYVPATHLIVHHTVSANSGPDHNWAAVMYAVWDFHANSRGWGDIGYNYLIDINGVIYEGHMNEDYENLDVVGTHASGANAGSMAVSLMGNFVPSPDGIAPSQPMLNSLVDIMAWKAEQRNINVYDAGNELPNINWGLPYLMGHRDVYGTTQCPGEQMHILLPWLRDQVATRISLVDPYQYIQELDPEFTKSAANWRVPTYNCGHNLHAYYTWSTDDEASSSNWAEWEINVPKNGRYIIDAHIPYCSTGRSETDGATYAINHASGASQITFSQNNNVGLWMNLGQFDFTTEGNFSVYLSDLTTTDSGLGVWFDSLRFIHVDDLPVPPQSINNTAPINGYTTDNPEIDFAWIISNTYPVLSTTLQISADVAFGTIIHEETWNTAVSAATHTLNSDGTFYWRTQAILDKGDNITDTITSTPTTIIIDTAVPDTISNTLPTDGFITNNPEIDFAWTIFNTYPVLSTTMQISADDAFSTTIHEESWSTAVTTTTHTLNSDGAFYWRTQAILDKGDSITKTITSTPTTLILDTAVPTSTITDIYEVPNVGYSIFWAGTDATSGVDTYNIYYRLQSETDWTAWLTDTTITNGFFQPQTLAEIYEFAVQATDKASNQESPPTAAEGNTDQAILLSHAIMLPIVAVHD